MNLSERPHLSEQIIAERERKFHHAIVYLDDPSGRARRAHRFSNPEADYDLARLGMKGISVDGDVECLLSTVDGDYLIRDGYIILVQESLENIRGLASRRIDNAYVQSFPVRIGQPTQIGDLQIPAITSFLLNGNMLMPPDPYKTYNRIPDVFTELEEHFGTRLEALKASKQIGHVATSPLSPAHVRRTHLDRIRPSNLTQYL